MAKQDPELSRSPTGIIDNVETVGVRAPRPRGEQLSAVLAILAISVAAYGNIGHEQSAADIHSLSDTISPVPDGPKAPKSGWKIVFGDSFARPLGTGRGKDNLWWPNQPGQNDPSYDTAGNNPYETEEFTNKMVHVKDGNLILRTKYQKDVAPADSTNVQRDYISGMVTTAPNHTGYKGFTWTPGNRATWAFQITAQLPADKGGIFPAFYSSSFGLWKDERDFFEGHSVPKNTIDTNDIYETPFDDNGMGTKEQSYYLHTLDFNPASREATYTYEIDANGTWKLFINGVLQRWVGNDGVAPYKPSYNGPEQVIIDYATTTSSPSQNNTWLKVDSVEVFEDRANANTTGGGIAPGTIVGT